MCFREILQYKAKHKCGNKSSEERNSVHLTYLRLPQHLQRSSFQTLYMFKCVLMCGHVQREKQTLQRMFLMAQLSQQTRSIGPSALHLKINASQHKLGRKTGECFSGRGDLKSLRRFLYEVRLHDVIMDSLHACYGNSLMASECRKSPS